MRARHYAWLMTAKLSMLVGGCSIERLTVGRSSPDLTGTYSLIEYTQGGVTLTLPLVAGTLVLEETSGAGRTASGTYTVDMTVSGNRVVDEGTYTVDAATNAWMQRSSSNGTEVAGTFTLDARELVVDLTTPAAATARAVWFQGFVSGSR